jgi:hypothetical protein
MLRCRWGGNAMVRADIPPYTSHSVSVITVSVEIFGDNSSQTKQKDKGITTFFAPPLGRAPALSSPTVCMLG